MSARVIYIRVPEEIAVRVDELVAATGMTKNGLTVELLRIALGCPSPLMSLHQLLAKKEDI